MSLDAPAGEFNVVEFYQGGAHAFVECSLDARKAVTVAFKRTRKACNRYSTVTKVVVTNGSDNTVFEWRRNIGITFPTIWKGSL